MTQDELAKKRMERNADLLELKKREVEARFTDGKVKINVQGTLDDLTPGTILAIPSALQSGNKVPGKAIRILTYDQPGEGATLLKEEILPAPAKSVDIDELIARKLGKFKEPRKKVARKADKSAPAKFLAVDSADVAIEPVSAVGGDQEEVQEIGRVVRKPRTRKIAKAAVTVDKSAVLDTLKTLLGHK